MSLTTILNLFLNQKNVIKSLFQVLTTIIFHTMKGVGIRDMNRWKSESIYNVELLGYCKIVE